MSELSVNNPYMTPHQFVFFLKGMLELVGTEGMNERQTKILRENLDNVFDHGEKNKAQVEERKPTLAELLPDHTVIYSNEPIGPRPAEWQPSWAWDTAYRVWFDPNAGKMRC